MIITRHRDQAPHRHTEDRFLPLADTTLDFDRRYWLGSGYEVTCIGIGTARVELQVVSCPCAGITIEEGKCCKGHQRLISFDHATWKRHCADGWVRQLREEVTA